MASFLLKKKVRNPLRLTRCVYHWLDKEEDVLKAALFGIGQASYYDRDLPGFPGQQASLLLCYLLLNRQQPHHREQLATVFWPEHASDVARKYLRNALWRLRQTLQSCGAPPDEYLFYSEESITFINTSPYWLDVEIFEQSASRFQSLAPQQFRPQDAQQLAQAVDLYTGDLLVNVYDDWCLYERERLRLLYLNSLHKLMMVHGWSGAYQNSIGYGERILAQDNTREKVHRQLMWLHWLGGDREAALMQYRRCAQILRDELNASPLEETRALYEQMRSGQVHSQPPDWIETPTAPPAAPSEAEQYLKPLLEQTRHRLQQLQQMMEETRAELRQIERALDDAMLHT